MAGFSSKKNYVDDWNEDDEGKDHMNMSFAAKPEDSDFDELEEAEKFDVGPFFDRYNQKYIMSFVPIDQSPSDDEPSVEEQVDEIVNSMIADVIFQAVMGQNDVILQQAPKQTVKKVPSEFNMFWPNVIAQKAMDSAKKTTTALKKDISRASSSFFAKIRSPNWSRPSTPIKQSKITCVKSSSESTDKNSPSSSIFRKRRLKKGVKGQSTKVNRTFTDQSFLELDDVNHFLSEDEQEIIPASNQDVIPLELLDYLVQIQQFDYDYENSQRHSAFAQKDWNEIKTLYMKFCVHENPTIRLKMAQSVHEIARSIEPKLAEEDLCEIFQQFAKDTNEIRQTLIKNMYEFIEALPEKARVTIASGLYDFNTFELNSKWRLRYEFIQQLTRLISLFQPDDINSYLVPLALIFSADKISDIRLCAIEMLSLILAKFVNHGNLPLSDLYLNQVEELFWKSDDWRRRQSFAIMMKIVLENELISREMFCHAFNINLIELSVETIPNVRQYFCTIVDLFGRERLENMDQELHTYVFSRLHHLAASDLDLEVKMMARVSLGTISKFKNEVDLSCRIIKSDFSRI